ncbi:MAG: hypothetical protein A2622_09280 [Bdellovibrionales bacterium RIFCSPHIGHO2_01_FULL_40_29]|nr:MAG: hypothetical protein A2622_09280 [Bdellovibrionales bacterium RIFCSPHIGHO2_01_FULL_40_29]OFZ33583.1 MAG: hypothetical protein A3D17_00345 [Bdellovibrionales bacterium RIFCSPHIGHO2_02_FULL_40_15]
MSDIRNSKSLTEAIEKLEKLGKNALDDLKPHLQELKDTAESQVSQTKHEVEEKLKQSPWTTLITVGVIAFVIGLIFGRQSKDDSK